MELFSKLYNNFHPFLDRTKYRILLAVLNSSTDFFVTLQQFIDDEEDISGYSDDFMEEEQEDYEEEEEEETDIMGENMIFDIQEDDDVLQIRYNKKNVTGSFPNSMISIFHPWVKREN